MNNEELKVIFNDWKRFLSWCYKNNDKTIEKIKNLNSDDENDISTLGVALDFNTIKNKINEIIDILNKGDNND